MDKVKKLFLSKNESNSKVNLIIILLSITLFLVIGAASIGFSETSSTESSNLGDFIADVTITDSKNNPITDGTLYVGEKYNIQFHFLEEGAQGLQFTPDANNQLTYEIPPNFKADPITEAKLKVSINDNEVEIGSYSITDDGKLVITVTEDGKSALTSSPNIGFNFDLSVTAQPNPDGDDGNIHFGDVGEDFNFHVTDEPKLDVEKVGIFTEDEKIQDDNPKGGTLSYTVKTTVEHGKVEDVVITDTIKTTGNKSFNYKLQEKDNKPDVTVKIIRKENGEDKEYVLDENDYEVEESENNTFIVKLKENNEYIPLQEDDILEVTYNYRVDYVENSGDILWDRVENNVTVKGSMPLEDPENEPVEVEGKATNTTDINVTLPEHGVVIKDFDYDPQTKKVHYTLYTIIPKGEWSPLYIYDDIEITYNGKKYYMNEFKDGGRVSNLTVKAKDIDEWFKWENNTSRENKIKELKELIKDSQELKKYKFEDKDDDYDPDSKDNYIYKFSEQSLQIIFGLEKEERDNNHWAQWGHWNHEKDRLIVTEYDLDMQDGDITLTEMDNNSNNITVSAKDILLEGIYNSVNLRYGSYYPGDRVYFNTVPKMQKNGVKDEKNNTIEYTVSLNATDSTVIKYLEYVKDEYIQRGTKENDWNVEHGIMAVFYDQIPDGWQYVENSLYATTVDKWGIKYIFDDISFMQTTSTGPTDEHGDIYAPLILFRSTANNNLEMFNTFSSDTLVSLSFTYKIEATDKWIKDHAESDEPTNVDNHAEIKDKNKKYWDVDSTIPFMPARIIKSAEQESTSNLMHFTLKINQGGADLDDKNDYLIVTDTSSGIQIQLDTLNITDEEGNKLNPRGHITLNDQLGENEWGLLSDDENSSQYKLIVPDGKALTIKYDALIETLGENVEVSNSASIDGVVEAKTNYQGSLQVNNIYGSGEGNAYELTFEKVDKDNNGKKLKDAEFEFCIVLKEDSKLEKNKTIKIGEKSYDCYTKEEWKFTTGDNGQFKIEKKDDWNLDPGNYYIIEEKEAPEGYMLLEEPILFYYGMKNELDTENNPSAKLVIPNGKLTIENEPVPYKIPVTGGKGLKIFYVLGFLLTLLSTSIIISKKIKFNK